MRIFVMIMREKASSMNEHHNSQLVSCHWKRNNNNKFQSKDEIESTQEVMKTDFLDFM